MPRSPRFFIAGLVPFLIVVIAFGLVTVTCIPGCNVNPITTARTLNQKAYAVYGTFVVTEEGAARLKQDPSVAPSIKQALTAADAKAKPSTDALLQALQDYETASATLATGNTTADKLAVATASLNTWIAQANIDVTTLVNAVHGATRPVTP